jgi:LMBR1 domain-containing protein 1
MFSLFITLITVAVVPLDVYFISITTDLSIGTKQSWATPEFIAKVQSGFEIGYAVLYGLLIFMFFFVIPFVYFYFEESDDDTTSGDVSPSLVFNFSVLVLL